ncbi:glycoside hydrolase superfamily, partial [Chytriomyces sp. MP71]
AAMQMEGGWNLGGKGQNVFDAAYLNATMPGHGTPFRAADHYNKWKEDIGYLGQLGATAYRFSVSWPRILPNCTGAVNEEGIAFYSNLIDEVRRNGAEPFLTMFHWDLPQACQDQFNGFQSDRIIDAFAEYASV